MLIRVDPSSPVPLYDQIATAARRAIASGQIDGGDRLPPARTLAATLEVNMHTVLRAYRQLNDEGLVELRRGRGATVIGTDPKGLARLSDTVADLAQQARKLGVGAEEAIGMLRRAMP